MTEGGEESLVSRKVLSHMGISLGEQQFFFSFPHREYLEPFPAQNNNRSSDKPTNQRNHALERDGSSQTLCH